MTRLEKLKSKYHQKIAEFALVTDGVHTSIPFDEEGGVKIISAKHPKANYFDLNVFETVSQDFHSANPRTALRENDVIVSTVGTIGNSATVDTAILPANSDRHVGIIRIRDGLMPPLYLSTFLNSEYGRFQSIRESTGNVQLNLFISKMNTIIVPRFSETFENAVTETVRQAHEKREQASSLTTQAEALLLSALGLEHWQPPEALTYERSAKDVFGAGRLDAEHFQEKYHALVEKLSGYNGTVKTLGEIAADVTNGAEIREYQSEGTPYLRVADAENLDISSEKVVYVDPKKADEVIEKVRLTVGDVLVSRSGSLAVTAVIEEPWKDALISSHLIRVRIEDKSYDPYYLALFLSTFPGKQQILQWSNGGVQPEINQPSLKRVVVPYIPQQKQEEIKQAIFAARQSRNLSAQLLDLAKRAVEIAIEESEAAALAYLQAGQHSA